MKTKAAEVLHCAEELFAQGVDWVTFFREILGATGAVRQTFSNTVELREFERSQDFSTIQQMLARLRDAQADLAEDRGETRVITLRLPVSLHDSLRAEAHEHHTGLNKLCVSKLIQPVDAHFVPAVVSQSLVGDDTCREVKGFQERPPASGTRDWWAALQSIDAAQKQRGFIGTVSEIDSGDEGYESRMREIYGHTVPKNKPV